jgi:hypothetical protein
MRCYVADFPVLRQAVAGALLNLLINRSTAGDRGAAVV